MLWFWQNWLDLPWICTCDTLRSWSKHLPTVLRSLVQDQWTFRGLGSECRHKSHPNSSFIPRRSANKWDKIEKLQPSVGGHDSQFTNKQSQHLLDGLLRWLDLRAALLLILLRRLTGLVFIKGTNKTPESRL